MEEKPMILETIAVVIAIMAALVVVVAIGLRFVQVLTDIRADEEVPAKRQKQFPGHYEL
ncbi:MAG: hypothetical protein WC768_05075 [Patescibacteria group bacterium]